ncbi:hypothetical protein GJV85_08755 [Sulfurimonas aquatica]|uniref:Uncharacterized protein n=1 Tax=Sulfurimonas aquatica TaxID=2672570 RepID=A0A975B0X6_9BACT|nr:hypothetical protein [Sulfurimonas aquatica]QSZ42197.1 hypothetical protein GJV85_08755 [Sulfurimonas aquatica]
MAVTLEQISKWMDLEEFKHDLSDERIVSMSSDEDSKLAHILRAPENGEMFKWTVQLLDDNSDMIDIKEHKYAGKVISHMLYLNYTTKFGTWEFDPSDGDMRLCVEIPLEDALMTQKQFKRIYGYMRRDAHNGATEILHILNNGEIPKTEEPDAAAMIAKLEAMLATLKDGSSDDSDDVI